MSLLLFDSFRSQVTDLGKRNCKSLSRLLETFEQLPFKTVWKWQVTFFSSISKTWLICTLKELLVFFFSMHRPNNQIMRQYKAWQVVLYSFCCCTKSKLESFLILKFTYVSPLSDLRCQVCSSVSLTPSAALCWVDGLPTHANCYHKQTHPVQKTISSGMCKNILSVGSFSQAC